MTQFFVMFGSFWQRIFNLLSSYSFDIGGRSVSLTMILLSALFWSVLIGVFWKGARA